MSSPVPVPVDPEVLARIRTGSHWAPHDVLGAHPGPDGVVFRALRPGAESVTVVTAADRRLSLRPEPAAPADEGPGPVWSGLLAGADAVPDYRLEVVYPGDPAPVTEDDAYRYLPTLGEVDLHLIGEGRHETLWTVLGSHVRRYPDPMAGPVGGAGAGEVTGVSFAVWAPNAQAVQVVGDRNGWDGLSGSMRSLGHSGVWEIFLPGWAAGDVYKYRILTADGRWVEHADPLARRTERPPATASVVWESDYAWGDGAWLADRAAHPVHDRPMSVYEVHLGSWRPGLGYRELADELPAYVLDMGFTHVEFLPVAEHPFAGSWGYQVTGYYAPTARFGTPDDFRYLVDALHRAGIGVLLDWVPAHFPRDAWALARFDGQPLYEYADPRKGEHPDWGTLVFDFGRNEVRNFLVANAVYWLTEFHVDGLRVDAVASMLYLDYSREPGQWVPNAQGGRENLEAIALLQEANATAYRRAPGIVMVAEESTAWPGVTRPTDAGGLGFGLKWNMGWMHDSLEYMHEEPINRRWHHGTMTFSMIYAFTENFVLPISHDEVVHGKGSLVGKMPGDRWQQMANVRAYLAFMWAHPGKQLLFMGQEFAQGDEWSADNGLEWWLLQYGEHQGVQQLVRDLNRVYRGAPELWSHDFDGSGFTWIDASDADHNLLSFVRRDGTGRELVCVVNFAGTPHEGFRVGFPAGGAWREVLNTDAEVYGGSGVGNAGQVWAEDVAWNGQPHSAVLRVPPLGALWFRRP